MTKEQALKIYMETDVKTECSLCQKRILKQIDTDFVSIIEDILKHIRIFYKGIVDKQQKKEQLPVNYIHFSFLMSGIKQRKVQILMEALPVEWYFGDCIYEMTFSVVWLENALNELYEILLKKSARFMGKITQMDVERILLEERRFYEKIQEALLKYAFEISLDEQDLKNMIKQEEVHIFVGEYRGEFNQIYTISEQTRQLREVFYGVLFNQAT